jgi:aminoglycoside phosphotransferase (APT) family kinase protein
VAVSGNRDAVAGDTPGPVLEGCELPWDRIETYITERVDDVCGPMSPYQFTAGAANLTYLLRFQNMELVLRRPPFGRLPPGAHDMRRENQVLSELWRSFSPAPRALLFCDDHSVAGADFLVVERRTGEVIRDHIPDSMQHHSDIVRRISYAVVDSMAELHLLDADKVGVGDLGRPDGFIERQVSGWSKRWVMAVTDDAPITTMSAVQTELARTVPKPMRTSILHNDLRVDNCQFKPEDPDRVAAMFDWDMATLGDPLVDLGTLLNYWPDPDDPPERRRGVTGFAGLEPPTRADITERYAERARTDVRSIVWYEAFALWKTAVVYQQLYHRFTSGNSQNKRAVWMATRIPTLAEEALELLNRDASWRKG